MKVWMLIAAFVASVLTVVGASAFLYANLDHEFGPRIWVSNPTIQYTDSCQSGGTLTARMDAALYNRGDRPGYVRVVFKQDATVVNNAIYFVREGDEIPLSNSFALECGSNPPRLTVEVSPF